MPTDLELLKKTVGKILAAVTGGNRDISLAFKKKSEWLETANVEPGFEVVGKIIVTKKGTPNIEVFDIEEKIEPESNGDFRIRKLILNAEGETYLDRRKIPVSYHVIDIPRIAVDDYSAWNVDLDAAKNDGLLFTGIETFAENTQSTDLATAINARESLVVGLFHEVMVSVVNPKLAALKAAALPKTAQKFLTGRTIPDPAVKQRNPFGFLARFMR